MITNKVNNGQTRLVTLAEAKYGLGQLITHNLFNYRGVIVDIDPFFLGSDAWYEEVAITRPPKDIPWYKVLVNDSQHETYVAEQNLQVDLSEEGINHPLINSYFDEFDNGLYINSKWRTH